MTKETMKRGYVSWHVERHELYIIYEQWPSQNGLARKEILQAFDSWKKKGYIQ